MCVLCCPANATEGASIECTLTNGTGDATVSVAESSSTAVRSYTAAVEGGGTVTWSLTGDDSDDFAISDSGVLTFATAPDYEVPTDTGTDNVYTVTLNATAATSRFDGTTRTHTAAAVARRILGPP